MKLETQNTKSKMRLFQVYSYSLSVGRSFVQNICGMRVEFQFEILFISIK